FCKSGGNFGFSTTCNQELAGNIPSNEVEVSGSSGSVTLVAQPGSFPPTDLATVPDVDGARVCAVVLIASNRDPFGGSLSQQFDLCCREECCPRFSLHHTTD